MTISTPYIIKEEPYQAVISIDEETGQWKPNFAQLCQDLQETANRPLIIDWTPSHAKEGEFYPNTWPHAAILLEHLHRWQEITIYVGYMPIDCFSSITGTSPWLETVLIEAPHSAFDTPQYSQHISRIWAKAPNFRSYTIKQFSEFSSRSRENMSMLRLPYANLHTLRIDSAVLRVDECVTILAITKRLLHCRFGSIVAPNAPFSTPLIHETLQSLFISSNWDEHCKELETFAHCLLERVRAPALRRLVVENDSYWDPTVFEQFLDDSECDLEALEFHMVKVSGHTLFSTIRTYCPNIRVFKTYADSTQNPPPISRTAWKRLRYNEGDTEVFLPKLTLLFVNDEALVDADHPEDALAAVVSSRLEKGLQVVWLQVDKKDTNLNACALRNMFPPGDVRSHWDLKHLVIDEDAQPEFWNDCVKEYLWPTGCGWHPPTPLDDEELEDLIQALDVVSDEDDDEDSDADASDMDCD